jgi:hypothetical protein
LKIWNADASGGTASAIWKDRAISARSFFSSSSFRMDFNPPDKLKVNLDFDQIEKKMIKAVFLIDFSILKV